MLKRRKIDPSNCTLIELVYSRTGSLRKTSRIVAYMLAWEGARDRIGHRPSGEEYAEFWRVSRATAFREQAEFRAAFPGQEDPSAVLAIMRQGGAGEAESLDYGAVA